MLKSRSIYPWVLVALLWVVGALNYVDRQVIFALFPLLRADLHLSSVQLGMLGTVFLWVYGVVSPFGGYLADRFSRRSVILASFAIWSAVTLLLGLAKSYGEVLTAQALMGVSEACYLPAALALIADYHGDATRSRAVGLHQTGLCVGVVLGGSGGGWIGQHYGWHGVFFLLGTGGLIYLAVLTMSLRETSAQRSDFDRRAETLPFSKAIAGLVRSRPFLLIVVANGLGSIAFWCVYTWLALFVYERYRVSLALAGFASTFYTQAGALAGIVAGGWLADRWARSNGRARGWTQTIGLMLAGPALLLVPGTASWWLLVPFLLTFGIGRGFYDCNLMPLLCQVMSEKVRATAYGVFNFTACICGGLMALIAGYLKEKAGLSVALQISGACLMVAALCIAVLSLVWLRKLGYGASTGMENELAARS